MTKIPTAFAVGRRYRCTGVEPGRLDPIFDFVIIGAPLYNHNSPKTHKRCRLEIIQHSYSSVDPVTGKCYEQCKQAWT
jgi:hypothetical protein